MWNAETAQFLHDWYATPEGTYAITQENRLFQHLISQWPRRGHTKNIGSYPMVFA